MADAETPAPDAASAEPAAPAAATEVDPATIAGGEPVEPQDPPLASTDVSLPDDTAAAALVSLPELGGGQGIGGTKHLNLLLDVGVEVAAVVGTRELKLEQVMSIQPGTIIDLEKRAGQPIELYVNGKPIALAEIVVVDGRLGARVVESLRQKS
jgi:flagellar motor switch protein FliN/FliY